MNPSSSVFCIFSIALKNTEPNIIVAGANDKAIYVYDIEANKRRHRLKDAHDDDVNSVNFDSMNEHVLYSASDDYMCKVWDLRIASSESANPVGCIGGHRGGITHVESKGDGMTILTNSKDQTIRVWDTRKMNNGVCNGNATVRTAFPVTRKPISSALYPRRMNTARRRGTVAGGNMWDYRWEEVSGASDRDRSSSENSGAGIGCCIAQFGGHRVLQTLMRAHYSPRRTTGTAKSTWKMRSLFLVTLFSCS